MTPTIAAAQTIETFTLEKREKACAEALKACDAAIEKADQVIKSQADIINEQDKQIRILLEQQEQLKKQRDSFFKNPLIWFLAGVIVGGITFRF